MSLPENFTVRSVDELAEFYHQSNADQNLLVGIEWERSGVYADPLAPVLYDGNKGYNKVLHKLVEEVGWEVVHRDGDNLFELQRGNTRITIEGDGRLELAGSPQAILHDLAREFRIHNNEVIEMGSVFGIKWISLGLQPFHTNEEIPLVGKERYRILQNLGDRELMATMTKRTNGLTANLSYTNEENAIRKAQTAFRVLPIISAMYASSPFDAGRPSPYLDTRRASIQNHCPERTGIPPNILQKNFRLRDWITYYAELPVILMVRPDGKQIRVEQPITFIEWMEKGYNGQFPTAKNFDQQIKTTWSDLRLRPSYLEYRVADSVPFRAILSLPALMKGLLFDSGNWKKVEELTADWTYDDIVAIDRAAWKEGLRTKVKGVPLLDFARQLLVFATDKLRSFERLDSAQQDESMYLQEIKEQILIKEKSYAEELLQLWETEWNRQLQPLVAWCEKP